MDQLSSHCCNGSVQFELETKASPAQVRCALTDFSSRRLQTWNRTLDPKRYELRAQGATWAVARESSRGSPFWVVVRYDWSDPVAIRWTVEESSYGGGGTGVARIVPKHDGGTRLSVAYDATDARWVGSSPGCGHLPSTATQTRKTAEGAGPHPGQQEGCTS